MVCGKEAQYRWDDCHIRLCYPERGCCTIYTRLPFPLGVLKREGSGYETDVHAYIHTGTYIHTYIQYIIHTVHNTYIHIYIYTYIHTYIHIYIHTYIIHTYVHKQLQTDLYAYNSERHAKHLTIKCGTHLLISAGSPFCLAASSLRFQTCK